MHILVLNELRANAERTVRQVFGFLGVESEGISLDTQTKRNVTQRPRSFWLHWLLRKLVFARNERLFYRIATFAAHRAPGYPPMDPELRKELMRFYAPHNAALASLTQSDISHWDTSPLVSDP